MLYESRGDIYGYRSNSRLLARLASASGVSQQRSEVQARCAILAASLAISIPSPALSFSLNAPCTLQQELSVNARKWRTHRDSTGSAASAASSRLHSSEDLHFEGSVMALYSA